jgi:hypothetical protein
VLPDKCAADQISLKNDRRGTFRFESDQNFRRAHKKLNGTERHSNFHFIFAQQKSQVAGQGPEFSVTGNFYRRIAVSTTSLNNSMPENFLRPSNCGVGNVPEVTGLCEIAFERRKNWLDRRFNLDETIRRAEIILIDRGPFKIDARVNPLKSPIRYDLFSMHQCHS